MPETTFIGKYRLTPQLALRLCEELGPLMRAPQRGTAVPLEFKVLVALHFFGHGSDQKSVASDHGIPLSQPRVSRFISEVVTAMNTLPFLQRHISFPETIDQRKELIQRNYKRFKFPGVLGYVDGAHMPIVAPSVHEEQYVNRHQIHSINVQITADASMLISNIVARYPGSTNDSFVWANSAIRQKMEDLYRGGEHCWLIGDSGYPHEPWLHVPFADPAPGTPEANFNRALRIDRSVVERTIGHLRNRFRCVSKHRVLEYAPQKAGQIINCVAVLHYQCVRAHIPLPDEEESSDSEDENDAAEEQQNNPVPRDHLRNEARRVRDRIVARIPPVQVQPFNPRRRHRRN
ncbi:Putative nuclease [Frankliniella fusca]|uniref:Nuclease n=1 Tax=Frankliniella fusca TaxID=407009 RepID=A0AAE1I2R1_9NEOP|nr:Putative nuclease [Frankliniella fusca]